MLVLACAGRLARELALRLRERERERVQQRNHAESTNRTETTTMTAAAGGSGGDGATAESSKERGKAQREHQRTTAAPGTHWCAMQDSAAAAAVGSVGVDAMTADRRFDDDGGERECRTEIDGCNEVRVIADDDDDEGDVRM